MTAPVPPWPLVIFDLDGTLADSHAAICSTADLVLAELGQPPVPAASVTALVGLPLRDVLAAIAPRLAADELDRAVASYREHYVVQAGLHTRLFPGVLELLDALAAADVTIAIATGKSTRGAHASLERIGLASDRFAAVLGGDSVPNPKPHPDMVMRILQDVGCDAAAACVVGDTSYDMEMARRAGAAAIGVGWGSHAPALLEASGAAAVAATRDALRAALLGEPSHD